MSELTKRMSECDATDWAYRMREGIDRIDALEECLREFLVAWDMRDDLEHELALTEAIGKTRALLEEK